MKLSIITVNLNNSVGLKRTAQSIIAQNFQDFEWIVMDGGSSDGSLDVIEEYKYRMSFWTSQKDSGIYNAMNSGVKKSSGEFVLFLNSGDSLFETDTLSKVFSKDCRNVILYGDCVITNYLNHKENIVRYPDKLIFSDLFLRGICHNATFIPRQILISHPFTESYKIASDWEFFIKMALTSYPFQHIDILVTRYEDGGLSTMNLDKNVQERLEIRDHLVPRMIIDEYRYANLGDLMTIRYLYPKIWNILVKSFGFIKKVKHVL